MTSTTFTFSPELLPSSAADGAEVISEHLMPLPDGTVERFWRVEGPDGIRWQNWPPAIDPNPGNGL